MERRKFLALLGLSAGAAAVEQAVPLGRVWSFPKQIVLATPAQVRFIRFDVLYGFGELSQKVRFSGATPGPG
jgi:hypothetical protein